MNRKFFYYVIILSIIISLSYTLFSKELQKGIQNIILGKNHKETEKVLLKYNPRLKKAEYYSINRYSILLSEHIPSQLSREEYIKIYQSIQKTDDQELLSNSYSAKDDEPYILKTSILTNEKKKLNAILKSVGYFYQYQKKYSYHSDSDVQITQNLSTNQEIINGKVQLKKVFGYKLGLNTSLNNTKVFSDTDVSKSEVYSPRPVYHYRNFPVKKINSLIEFAELTFYNDDLFKVLYKLNLTKESLNELLIHLKNKYNGKSSGTSFEGKKDDIQITLNPIDGEEDHYIIVYTKISLDNEYQNYIKSVKKKVTEIIENGMHHEIKQF